MIGWSQLSRCEREQTSIVDMLGGERQKQIKKNRHYLKSIAEVILLCCTQIDCIKGP